MTGWIVRALLLTGGSTAAFAGANGWISLSSGTNVAFVALGFGIAVLTFTILAAGRRRGYASVVRDVASWTLLISALAAGYNFRDELLTLGARVAAEIAPSSSLARLDIQSEGEQSVRIRRRPDGHFVARTSLNGTQLTMLVDTGASMVVLRPEDAQKLGIAASKLRYTVPVQTANGTTYAAPVTLKNVSIGQIKFGEIEALVAKPGTLRDSLLGMSFLNRLRSYEFSGDFLTLRI